MLNKKLTDLTVVENAGATFIAAIAAVAGIFIGVYAVGRMKKNQNPK